MAKHVKAFTYEPKIEAVRNGKCRQTIRPIKVPMENRFKEGFHVRVMKNIVKDGDEILFHGWSGKPYHSKWSWRLRVKVKGMEYVKMYKEGMSKPVQEAFYLANPTFGGLLYWHELDDLAKADGFKNGEEMGKYFNKNHTLKSYDGREMNDKAHKLFQIIRWELME